MRQLLATMLAAISLGACNLDSSTRYQRPGLLRLAAEDSINFSAPDTVALNADFTISATTYGGSCDTKGPTDVLPVSDGTIDFRPFDVTEVTTEKACPLETFIFTHTGTVKIAEAGSKTITLWGRDWNGTITSRAKTVVVRAP